MEALTSKERMLLAMRRGQPDMVPVAPDISNMIPCRLTGRPFWDIYYRNDPPLWKAYADAVRYFGFDGWHIYGGLSFKYKTECTFKSEEISRSTDRLVVRTTCSTPCGDLWSETTYYTADPPTVTRKWIKNLAEDMPKLRYMFPKITGYDRNSLDEQMAYVGETAAVGVGAGVPGMHDLAGWFDGGLESAVYAEADRPDLVAEFVTWQTEQSMRMVEMAIDARPDFIMLGASGLWTMQSPRQFWEYSLPMLRSATRMAREAGLPSFLHSCGKQRKMIDILAAETDLDVVNPLEPPPMGDCDLRELKETYGRRFAFMGNVHTTDVMLLGTPDKVREVCRRAIDDAAEGGGFILSTGDQCGRDTPDENIRAMIETAREYGRY